MSKQTSDWNLYRAAFLGAFTGASYVLIMLSLSNILSFRGLDIALPLMLVAAATGAGIISGIAAVLNLVKRSDRRRDEASDLFTSVALARLA